MSKRDVVVGTTSDYIDMIRRAYPGRVLFITDPAEREKAREETPHEEEELLWDLRDEGAVLEGLRKHMARFEITPSGIACFDCESLELSALLAAEMGLPFASVSSVNFCRNKFLSKKIWQENGVPCPSAALLHSPQEAAGFFSRLGGNPCVLKPLTGSGSQFLYKCTDRDDCMSAFEAIRDQLGQVGNSRLYRKTRKTENVFDICRGVLAEEFVAGQEYSCDFCIRDNSLEIIRMAKKVPSPDDHAGTTLAYMVPVSHIREPCLDDFPPRLFYAAKLLGLERALCMVDFIVRDGTAYLLEITPRPGGDCLPWVVRQSCGLDMLGLNLDFSRDLEISVPPPEAWNLVAGIRLLARDTGIVKTIDTSLLEQDPRVLEIHIKFQTGHEVVLPPKDYDSRIFGHVIFKPSEGMTIEEECVEIASKFQVKVDAKC